MAEKQKCKPPRTWTCTCHDSQWLISVVLWPNATTNQSWSWRPNFLRSFWGCTQNRWWRSERQLWLETLFCEILQGGVRVYERENLHPPVRSTSVHSTTLPLKAVKQWAAPTSRRVGQASSLRHRPFGLPRVDVECPSSWACSSIPLQSYVENLVMRGNVKSMWINVQVTLQSGHVGSRPSMNWLCVL